MFKVLEFFYWGTFVISTTYIWRIALLKLTLLEILVRQLSLSPKNYTLLIFCFSVLWILFSCMRFTKFLLLFIFIIFYSIELLWEDSLSTLHAYVQFCITWAIKSSSMPTIWVKAFLEPIEVNGNFVIHFTEASISLQLESYFLSLCGNVSFCHDKQNLINDTGKLFCLMKSYHFEVRSVVLVCISAAKEFLFVLSRDKIIWNILIKFYFLQEL